jgi:hypothetical protein
MWLVRAQMLTSAMRSLGSLCPEGPPAFVFGKLAGPPSYCVSISCITCSYTDIDGVIVRGTTVLPAALVAMKKVGGACIYAPFPAMSVVPRLPPLNLLGIYENVSPPAPLAKNSPPSEQTVP